ncbi:MAG: T9SS type A sorting domain-containing protein, partial [Bacteroidetes bacterium]|nr:T9SS type A sorting domain-containing protein [Bacteroidota bacterium]
WERNCVMDSVNFHDASVLANGVIVTDYIWDVDGETLTGTDPKFQFLTPGIRQVSLSLAFDNFCSVFVSKSIDVAEELLPGFSNGPLCVGQVSEFQDVTIRQGDDVIEWLWDINGDTVITQMGMLDYPFQETGPQIISLTITTSNGCDQFVLKPLVVREVPNPGFETSIDFGAAPLTVVFTNTTPNAELFQWIFQDPNDTRSSARDTTFTFDVLGDYNVTLEATNEFGCKESSNKLIQVVVPDLEVELENVNLVEDNGNLKIVLSINNNGTVTIDEMDILINLGVLKFVEAFSGTIIPLQSSNYTLDFKIPNLTKEQLEFVCFTLKPLNELYIENDTSNNEICLNFEDRPLIFNPFPNPAKDQIRISLLIPETKKVDFRLINSRGESVLEKTVNDIPTGLNTIILETPGFNPGLYLLQVTYENTSELFRVVIR